MATTPSELLPKAKILVVDDDQRTVLAITNVLEELGQELIVARSGEDALRHLLHDDYAVILLDLHMPGMDGYEVASLIRGRKRTRHIPIVFLTAVFRDDSHLLQAYSAGAVDMVFKPVDPFIIKSKVAVFVELYLKQAEIRREADLRLRLQEENLRVNIEKLTAEQELRVAKDRQQAILRSLPVCFLSRSADPPFSVVFVTGAVEQVTGFKAAQFEQDGEFAFNRIHSDDLFRLNNALDVAVRTGSYVCEYRWKSADGEYRTFLEQGVLVPANAGAMREVVGTILDITERRRLEQQLVQAQKMEAVGQLTGGIAHDFNNLLTVILGNVDLMERRSSSPDSERIRRQLVSMRHAAQRGQNLTSQLLAFSRRQHLNPEVLDVNAQLRKFEPLIRRAISEHITLRIESSDNAAVCEVDPAQLETSLLNLIVNARDAMPSGGTIEVAVRRVEQSDEIATEYPELPSGPWVVIAVTDSGIGMPGHVVSRAFEPFFTTKELGKGSGLGLSQVYGFVRQSGGVVTLSSTVGAGTCISVYLPPSDKPLPDRVSRPESEEIAPANAESVLIVEDDSSVLALTSEMLRELGYRVITASDADGAIEVLSGDQPVDFVFSDVVMPNGKTGVELAVIARQMRPGIKVLLTSGYTGEALDRHRPENFPIIAKPFRQAELAAKIRNILDDGGGSAALH